MMYKNIKVARKSSLMSNDRIKQKNLMTFSFFSFLGQNYERVKALENKRAKGILRH